VNLNYGLRYEYYSPLKEANNRQIYFDIVTGVLRDPSGDPLIMKKNNFGPRVALTWSPNPRGTGFFWWRAIRFCVEASACTTGRVRLKIKSSRLNLTASVRR